MAKLQRVPRPPIVQRPIGIPPKVDGVGVDVVFPARTPLATCLHSMVGTLWGTDGYFRNPEVQALTDFGIGQVAGDDGLAEILQWNDPFGNLAGWANGVVSGPTGVGKRFIDTYGLGQVNRGIVSIETEDGARPVDAQGRPTALATAGQWAALCWLLAYIHDTWLDQWAANFDWHLHHRDLATKDCPFPRLYGHTEDYLATVGAIMRHWNEGVPYRDHDRVVAGLAVVVPERDGGNLVLAGRSPGIRGFRGLWAGRS